MLWCVAYGSSNNSSKKDGPNKRFFYNEEKDRQRHTAWVKLVNRVDWYPCTSSRLCEDHFEREAFLHPPQVFLSVHGRSGILRLKPDAVPTLQKIGAPGHKEGEEKCLCIRLIALDSHPAVLQPDITFLDKQAEYGTAMLSNMYNN